MRDLKAFRHAVTQHRHAVGRTQQELARAIGLHPHVLSHKLNDKDALLSTPDAVAIVTVLVNWGAVADQAEVRSMLDLLDVPAHVIPSAEQPQKSDSAS